MKTKSKKATFVIREGLLDEAREIVRSGSFKSLNALVEEAISEIIGQVRREEYRQALVEASRDPLFLSDLEEVERDFERVDEEFWGPLR